MEKKRNHWSALAGMTAALGLLPAYVGAYYANVHDTKMFGLLSDEPTGRFISPQYCVAQTASEVLFYPIHQIDRTLRPDHWAFPF
jgi:hypothetical protein